MKTILIVLVLLLSTNLYSWDEVEYFDSKPNPNIIKEQEKRLKDKDRDRRDSDYYDRRDRNSDYDRNDKYDRRDRNSDYDRNDRRDSDYYDYNDKRDRRDSDYKDYNDKDYNDKRDSGYRDYKDYKDYRDDNNYNRRDSDYKDYNDGDRRDRDYREYDNRDRDRDHNRRERDKEKIIWEEVSKEDSINGYKAFLKTFPNSYYANLAKYKIEKLTSYGEIDAKALEAYKNIPYWVTNGELEDKSEQCAVASIDLDRDNQIKSLREVEKQAKDILSRNHYLLSTDIIKTNFYILDKKIYALAYVYNNSKAERNKKMFYKQH